MAPPSEQSAHGSSSAWRFGFVPTTRVLVDRSLVARVAAALGASWELVAHDDYGALVAAATNGSLAGAWLPPVAFARAHRRASNVTPLFALARGGYGGGGSPAWEHAPRAQYVSALVVPRASAVQSARELRGLRAAWVDRWSAAGYLVARRTLREAGVDPDRELGAQAFVGSYTEVIEAVAVGRADFGAVYCSRAEDGSLAHAGWTVQDELRPVAFSRPIPGDVICALPALLPDRLATLSTRFEALVGTREGRELLRAFFNAEALAPVDTAAYSLLEDALDPEPASH